MPAQYDTIAFRVDKNLRAYLEKEKGDSILSYCGSATLSVIADANLVPDPEAITQEFNREFAAMLKAVRANK